jgi:hypothetical protein
MSLPFHYLSSIISLYAVVFGSNGIQEGSKDHRRGATILVDSFGQKCLLALCNVKPVTQSLERKFVASMLKALQST